MRVTWLSASFAKRTGLQPEVLLGNRRQDLRTEDVGDDDWAAHLADLAAHRPFRDFTYSLRDGEGRQRLLQISGKPVFGPNRRFLGYRGTGRDITAEGEANRRLRESENRFRSLVENFGESSSAAASRAMALTAMMSTACRCSARTPSI